MRIEVTEIQFIAKCRRLRKFIVSGLNTYPANMRLIKLIYIVLFTVGVRTLFAQQILPKSGPSPDTIVSYVKSPYNELHSGPDGSSDKITSIPQYETVLIVGRPLNNYCKVIYQGKIGYVYKTHLDLPGFDDPKDKKDLIRIPGNAKETFRTYNVGPRGGCYYINSSGNKSYVKKKLCED